MSSSPTMSHSDTLSSTSNSSIGDPNDSSLNTTCNLCNETYTIPKVLSCFHTFCQPCLEKIQEVPEKITCSQCHQDTLLGPSGLSGLLPDYAVSAVLQLKASTSSVQPNGLTCTGCKSSDTNAVARCFDCANFLCQNCVMAHQFMHCFEGHRVKTLTDLQEISRGEMSAEKPVTCTAHKNEPLIFFCRACNIPLCQDCAMSEHQGHGCEQLSDIGSKLVEALQQMVGAAKVKANNLASSAKGLDHSSNRLQIQYHKAETEINETFSFYRAMLDERKQELLKELESAYKAKQLSLNGMLQKMQESSDKLYQGCEFIEKLTNHANITEILMFKKLIDSKIQGLMGYVPDSLGQSGIDLEFVSNYQAIQAGVRNTFGYVRQDSEVPPPTQKPQPIARPNGTKYTNRPVNGVIGDGMSGQMNGGMNIPVSGSLSGPVNGSMSIGSGMPTPMNSGMNGPMNGNIFDSDLLGKRYGGSNSSLNSLNSLFPMTQDPIGNPYDKWSTGGMDMLQNGTDIFSTSADPINDLTSKLITTANIYPPKSQIKRQKMIYHCKFGEFGVMEGQFTEPSGVAVNAQNDIVVADTNNHRIQIFDREGRFKFQFGECGKRDGQLLYPNRVAVIKNSGDIVVTERSPTHQVQIYNQYGQFVRKFGANILQHPRGVTVDNRGRIIIVECKVMRVLIFDQLGNVLQKFGCSKHLEFPNGVVVNDKEEIFISDNRAHCVKVFNYQGIYLRQIGGEGITNYPIGVGINSTGEILIADNHNNFNLTIFTQDGNLVNALESKVKHAQCFDVSLLDDASIVLASKDYRLYVYRYLQVPSMGGFGMYSDNMMEKLYGIGN